MCSVGDQTGVTHIMQGKCLILCALSLAHATCLYLPLLFHTSFLFLISTFYQLQIILCYDFDSHFSYDQWYWTLLFRSQVALWKYVILVPLPILKFNSVLLFMFWVACQESNCQDMCQGVFPCFFLSPVSELMLDLLWVHFFVCEGIREGYFFLKVVIQFTKDIC